MVGDVLVTSGLEGSFAKGLKIGEIEKVEKKEHELFLQVKVTPSNQFLKTRRSPDYYFNRRIQEQSDPAMNEMVFPNCTIFLLLIPVQTLLLEKIQIAGVKPDLALILVYCFSWAKGEIHGLLWGVALGGLIDLFSIGLLGVNFILENNDRSYDRDAGEIFFKSLLALEVHDFLFYFDFA
ncbi:MAG: hypothetical protein MPW15_12125 [Candidatus Manganitrophus sp.]|nr:hypothetical protein [Candidatus Manganitrophus sp.]